jgi:hypothetical protein
MMCAAGRLGHGRLARVPPLVGVGAAGLGERLREDDCGHARRREQRQLLALGRGREQRRESCVCHGEVDPVYGYGHGTVTRALHGDKRARGGEEAERRWFAGARRKASGGEQAERQW